MNGRLHGVCVCVCLCVQIQTRMDVVWIKVENVRLGIHLGRGEKRFMASISCWTNVNCREGGRCDSWMVTTRLFYTVWLNSCNSSTIRMCQLTHQNYQQILWSTRCAAIKQQLQSKYKFSAFVHSMGKLPFARKSSCCYLMLQIFSISFSFFIYFVATNFRWDRNRAKKKLDFCWQTNVWQFLIFFFIILRILLTCRAQLTSHRMFYVGWNETVNIMTCQPKAKQIIEFQPVQRHSKTHLKLCHKFRRKKITFNKLIIDDKVSK